MKGKKIKEINPLIGVLDTMRIIAYQDNSHRDTAITTEEDNWIVDTVCATDTQTWETGIKRNNDSWVIVEQYEDKGKAKQGHNKWVEIIRKNPKVELEDIDVWGID